MGGRFRVRLGPAPLEMILLNRVNLPFMVFEITSNKFNRPTDLPVFVIETDNIWQFIYSSKNLIYANTPNNLYKLLWSGSWSNFCFNRVRLNQILNGWCDRKISRGRRRGKLSDFFKKGAANVRRWMGDPGALKIGFKHRFKAEIERLPVDWTYLVLLVLLSVWLFVLSGCAASGQQVRQDTPDALKKVGYPKSLAILPFSNKTDQPGIEKFVRATFYSHMSPYPYRDIELQVIDRTLRRHRLYDSGKLRKTRIKKLGRLLKCEAVVFGEVSEYKRLYAGIYSQMAVGASVEMWDTRTGRKIWSETHVTRRHEGGIPLTLTDIPMIGIRSGMNLTETAKVQTVDDLSRQLTGRIPVPGLSRSAADHDGSKWRSMKKLTYRMHTSKYRSLKRLTKRDRVGGEPTFSVSMANSLPDPEPF